MGTQHHMTDLSNNVQNNSINITIVYLLYSLLSLFSCAVMMSLHSLCLHQSQIGSADDLLKIKLQVMITVIIYCIVICHIQCTFVCFIQMPKLLPSYITRWQATQPATRLHVGVATQQYNLVIVRICIGVSWSLSSCIMGQCLVAEQNKTRQGCHWLILSYWSVFPALFWDCCMFNPYVRQQTWLTGRSACRLSEWRLFQCWQGGVTAHIIIARNNDLLCVLTCS